MNHLYNSFINHKKNGKKKRVLNEIKLLITKIFSQSGSNSYIPLYISSGMKIVRYGKKERGTKQISCK